MTPPRRKKWTEAEEKTLIDKYGEMVSDGTLAKMKTREKKYRPIAIYVDSVHHLRDPVAYPWHWTWKDVSTKVQNMRHQYLLVKQKIKRPESTVENSGGQCGGDEFDWVEGLTHWSNFLLYKEVFGDLPASCNASNNVSESVAVANEGGENSGVRGKGAVAFGQIGHSGERDFVGIDVADNGALGLGFECDGEEGEEHYSVGDRVKENHEDGFLCEEVDPDGSDSKKKRKASKRLEKRSFGFLASQFRQLKEMEVRFEQCEDEREQDRRRRENLWAEREKEWDKKLNERQKEREERDEAWERLKRQRLQEWEAMEKDSEDRERRRREEEMSREREWEERMSRRRSEWLKRMDEMFSQHRAEMGQMQTRLLHEQQSFTSQLVAIFSQWTGHSAGLSDHPGASGHYFSQMMQNLHHVNGMVHGDSRVEGENQDDQFIVDG